MTDKKLTAALIRGVKTGKIVATIKGYTWALTPAQHLILKDHKDIVYSLPS